VSVSKRKFSLFYFFLTALLKFCKLWSMEHILDNRPIMN
jgi:hypothetical protein